MMKSLKYLLISAVALFVTNPTLACWDDWYGPAGYHMYRVHPTISEPELNINWCYPGSGRNCADWQRLTSSTIPLEDIYEVVYTISLADFEKIYDNRTIKYDNKFVEWITKRDSAILDFLLLAKTNEHIRVKRNSRWYYPTMEIGARMTIEEVVVRALSADDARLRDRYLLQAVRALFSMQRYQECVDLWESEASKLPADNQMRELIHPYIAGAEFRLNRLDRAIEYFAQIGDVESMLFCANREGERLTMCQALDLVYEYAPNSPYITKRLQTYIRSIEPEGYVSCWMGSGYFEELDRVRKEAVEMLLPYSLKKARECKDDNTAMWYYTSAFLSDLVGETTKAEQYLSLAEKAKASQYIAESIKVMRIYLDAKLSTYDSAYEAKLFEQLKWLDSQVAGNITDEVRIVTAQRHCMKSGWSYYYWNDILRRIVLAEVCPRMLKVGKTTRALQLANMADNRLYGLVNMKDYHKMIWDKSYYRYELIEGSTLREFRYAKNKHNDHDYSNHFFEMIDSLGLNSAEKYVQNVFAPQSEFDRYLNARGYTEGDYLNDIVGTQSLREMYYDKAVKYLSNVSNAYNSGHLNVKMRYNPFSIKRKPKSANCDTRLEFARVMHWMEQRINNSPNPNERAVLMLRFAVGLRNSFDWCWPLTQYYRGVSYWGCVTAEKRDWLSDKYTTSAFDRCEQMIAAACATATDAEVAANINFELDNFKTIVEQYPDTQKAKYVRGRCDNFYDYYDGVNPHEAYGYSFR